MAQFQEESLVIPSNTFLPGYISSMFESESAPESLLDQLLAEESEVYISPHQFQYGTSTVAALSHSPTPLSMLFAGFDGQNMGTSEFASPHTLPSASATHASIFHPATEEEPQSSDARYSPYPYTEEELLGQNVLFQSRTHASPPAHSESGWDILPQDSLWPTNSAPVLRSNYPSWFMQALAFPGTNEDLGSMPGPSASYGTEEAYATANEGQSSIHDRSPFTPVSPFANSTNQYGNQYQTFSNTIGEGLGIHNIRSTGEQQTVEDECSGDYPVEHNHSERNTHGRVFQSGLYSQNNASEWLPGAYESLEEEVPHTNAGTWTDESIAPEQPAPSISQVQGHIPSCMGGLGVSVTRERKRRKDRGFRFVNLAAS
ncbi:hypothetical protein JR316_0007629 [Psilocybe cubensis]|uniref:Uncharacterized protein n=2 Tax=Psilocybe cubensis TaxID=181762 RepID=A0A8H8CIC3_PSICU|nr:hypothetical protein JR316_0007629 [Psilocybe cubensis]KAH9479053.1 hypothetical protein JR316_0007629 [Psilocybe cubensis]